MIGVIGWCSAIACSPAGIVSGGTNALLRYGRNITMNEKAPAASGLLANRPNAAPSQEIATMNASSTPIAPSQPSGPASGLNPAISATQTTIPVEATLRSTLATTWPVSTAEPGIGSERKRSITPLVMSWQTATAVVAEPNPAHSRMIPGTT